MQNKFPDNDNFSIQFQYPIPIWDNYAELCRTTQA